MSVSIAISDNTAHHLRHLDLEKATDPNEKVKFLLIAEYQRRLAHYRLTDRKLSKEYKMDFAAFEQRQVTKQKNYGWRVESDAMAWETAIDGIATLEKQLNNLRNEAVGR